MDDEFDTGKRMRLIVGDTAPLPGVQSVDITVGVPQTPSNYIYIIGNQLVLPKLPLYKYGVGRVLRF
jgi:hypothetical protein